MGELVSLAKYREEQAAKKAATEPAPARVRELRGFFNDASIRFISIADTAGDYQIGEFGDCIEMEEGDAVIHFKNGKFEGVPRENFRERFPELSNFF